MENRSQSLATTYDELRKCIRREKVGYLASIAMMVGAGYGIWEAQPLALLPIGIGAIGVASYGRTIAENQQYAEQLRIAEASGSNVASSDPTLDLE